MAKQANEQKSQTKNTMYGGCAGASSCAACLLLLLVPGSTIALAGRDNALYFFFRPLGMRPAIDWL